MVVKTINYFDIGQICVSGQCFRMSELENGWYEVIATDKYLRVKQEGNVVTFDCDEAEFESFWRRYFDFDTDYEIFVKAVDSNDDYLAGALKISDGIRILNQDFWEMIVSFLISQQNNITRIRKCISNISMKYGKQMTNKYGEVYYAFPTAESMANLAEDALMECNLGYRSKYVVRTSKAVAEGLVDLAAMEELDYLSSKEELLKLYGVGKKVADCICLFALHHLEAFPVDTHINQALNNHYAEGFPFERYKGFEGVIQQYIFYQELHGDE